MGRSQHGATLLEMAAALALGSALLVGLGAVLSAHANVYGTSQDDENVFAAAQAALAQIRAELAGAVQAPAGVTALPAYAISETSITFRPAEGHIARDDPERPALVAAGLVSVNDIRYAPYAKTIAYDPAESAVVVLAEGTLPPGMPARRTIARRVAQFRFFDGESAGDPPAAASVTTWVLGIEIIVRAPSRAPGARGTLVDSSWLGVPLREKVRLFPELIFTMQSKPAVHP